MAGRMEEMSCWLAFTPFLVRYGRAERPSFTAVICDASLYVKGMAHLCVRKLYGGGVTN